MGLTGHIHEESRIMKAGNSELFEQAYNAQAAVDSDGSMLITGCYVTDHGNDKLELKPIVESGPPEIRKPSHVSADTGFSSEKAVLEVENNGAGPTVYCAVEKYNHHRSVGDLLKKAAPPFAAG